MKWFIILRSFVDTRIRIINAGLVLTSVLMLMSCGECPRTSYSFPNDSVYHSIERLLRDSVNSESFRGSMSDSIWSLTQFHLSRTSLPSREGDTMLVALCMYVRDVGALSSLTVHKAVRSQQNEWRVGNSVWAFSFTYQGMLHDDVSSAMEMDRYVRNEFLVGRFIEPKSCKPDYEVIRKMPMRPFMADR